MRALVEPALLHLLKALDRSTMLLKTYKKTFPLVLVFFSVLLLCGCAQDKFKSQNYGSPIFTNPTQKLIETQKQAFSKQLFNKLIAIDPRIAKHGTQVNMVYWSNPKNFPSVTNFMKEVSNAPSKLGQPLNIAIWIGGTTSYYTAPYVTMNREYWYDRANRIQGKVIINKKEYIDPYLVTPKQPFQLWGNFSQSYTNMAVLIKKATGRPVESWCYVQGAFKNRTFYTYELPNLQKLEKSGIMHVHFAKTEHASWKNPKDWAVETANAPQPITTTP